MGNLLYAFNGVFSLLIFSILGYLFKRFGILDRKSADNLNNICYIVLFPVSLFCSMEDTGFPANEELRMVIFSVGGVLFFFLLIHMAASGCGYTKGQKGAVVFTAIRANSMLFGMEICQSLFGAEGENAMAAMVAVVVTVCNLLGILYLSVLAENRLTAAGVKRAYRNFIKNPLIIGVMVGLFWNLTGRQIPILLKNPLEKLSVCGTPLAVIVLGAKFDFKSIKNHLLIILHTSVWKLVLMPVILAGIAAAMNFRGVHLAAILSFFGAPSAISTVSICASMGFDSDLAGEIVLVTTLGSLLTLFMGLFVFRMMAFI